MLRTMKICHRLKTFLVFSCIPFIIGNPLRISPAVNHDQVATDGDLFVKRIVHGEKISDKPEMLMFTAPYRLCEGECEEDQKNFVMAFPLFFGKLAKGAYKKRYHRDFEKRHRMSLNAPFKPKTTRAALQLLKSNICPFNYPSTITQPPAVKDNGPITCLQKDYCDPQFLISNCPDIKKRICHEKTSQGTTSTVPPFFEEMPKDPIMEIEKNLRTADNLFKNMMRRRKTITLKTFSIKRKKETTVSDFVDNDGYLYVNIDKQYEHPLLYRTYKTLGPYKPTNMNLAYNYY